MTTPPDTGHAVSPSRGTSPAAAEEAHVLGGTGVAPSKTPDMNAFDALAMTEILSAHSTPSVSETAYGHERQSPADFALPAPAQRAVLLRLGQGDGGARTGRSGKEYMTHMRTGEIEHGGSVRGDGARRDEPLPPLLIFAPRLSASQEIGEAAAFFTSPTAQALSAASGRALCERGAHAPRIPRHAPDFVVAGRGNDDTRLQSLSSSLGPQAPPMITTTQAAEDTTRAPLRTEAWSSSVVEPTESSIFYPLGQAAQPPLLLHYVQLGQWRTVAAGRDYFNHRRLSNREVIGHTVRWLHNARPRGRFVFLIEPVEEQPADEKEDETGMHRGGSRSGLRRRARRHDKRGLWARIRRALFGPAPAFAYNRGKLAKTSSWLSTHAEAEAEDEGSVYGPSVRPHTQSAISPIAHTPAHRHSVYTSSPLSAVSPLLNDSIASSTVSGIPLSEMQLTASPTARMTSLASYRLGASSTPVPVSRTHHDSGDASTIGHLSLASTITTHTPNRYRGDHNVAFAVNSTIPPTPSRRNKAIRRMLVARLFGSEGPCRYNQGVQAARSAIADPAHHEPLDRPSPMPRDHESSHRLSAAPVASSPSTARTSSLRSSVCRPHATASVPERALFVSQRATSSTRTGHTRRPPHTSASVDLVASSLTAYSDEDLTATVSGKPKCLARAHSQPPPARSSRASQRPTTITTPISQRRESSLPRDTIQCCPLTVSENAGVRSQAKVEAELGTSAPREAPAEPISPAPAAPRRGVEVIEIAHADVTALDYGPRLLSSRFSIETKAAYTYFFPSTAAACCYYGCPEVVELIQAQLHSGVSAHIPKSTETSDARVRASDAIYATPSAQGLEHSQRMDQEDADTNSAPEDAHTRLGTRTPSHAFSSSLAAVATTDQKPHARCLSPQTSARCQQATTDRPAHPHPRADISSEHEDDENSVDDEDDGTARVSIAAALKCGVLPSRAPTHTPIMPALASGSRARSASSTASRVSCESLVSSPSVVHLERGRGQTSMSAPPPQPQRLSSASFGHREKKSQRPPSLFAGFPSLGAEATAGPTPSPQRLPFEQVSPDQRQSTLDGVHTPPRLATDEDAFVPAAALWRSPLVAPPPAKAGLSRRGRTPPDLYSSATKVFNDARTVRPVEPRSSDGMDETNDVRSGTREEEVQPRGEVQSVPQQEGASLAKPSGRHAARLLAHSPVADPNAAHAARCCRRFPVAAPAVARASSAFDWRTLNVDAAPLPCRVPAEPIRPVLMSSHLDVIVSVYTADPHFNAALCELLMPESGTHPYTVSAQEQQRLLSMYETGMPSWAIFMGSLSLIQYRRAYRVVYTALVNLWPLVSLGVGVYDLYRHLPKMKHFMAHTIEPLVRSIEAHFTLRVSVWSTYLFSVLLTIFSSLSLFFSQFYVVQVLSPVVALVTAVLKLPCILLLESVWSSLSIAASFMGLIWMTVKVLILGPFLLVLHIASWFGATPSAATNAMRGTSLTMRWWWAWQEFWITVASPIKNLAKAWWDWMLHVTTSISRREATLRRWYTARMTQVLGVAATSLEHMLRVTELAADIVCVNAHMWWPELRRLADHAPAWGQWLWLWSTMLMFAHLLWSLEDNRQRMTDRRVGALALQVPSDAAGAGSTPRTHAAGLCPVTSPPEPPLALPGIVQWLWRYSAQAGQVCFTSLVRSRWAWGGWRPQNLCEGSWVPKHWRYAASPPCVVEEMNWGLSEAAVSSVYSLSASPRTTAEACADNAAAHPPLYTLPFDRYPHVELTEDAAYRRDVLHVHTPGTTRIEFRMRFEEA